MKTNLFYRHSTLNRTNNVSVFRKKKIIGWTASHYPITVHPVMFYSSLKLKRERYIYCSLYSVTESSIIAITTN